MLGLMQDWPLLIHKIMDHAEIYHAKSEVVSHLPDGTLHRTNWGEIAPRSRRVASALEKKGIKPGDRVGTLALNSYRHIEAWYGITGMGAVYHTLNPRLFPEQLSYIANHAEDQALFFDPHLADTVAKIAPLLKTVKFYVAMCGKKDLPKADIPNLIAYEDFIAEGDPAFVWKEFDENTAAGLCYTSGTTGNPKGVLYSHRSTVLHALVAIAPDAQGLSSRDVVFCVVQMYHANAWALAFTVPIAGAKLILPSLKVDGETVYNLMESEKATMSAAVPTVWLGLLGYLEDAGKGKKFSTLKRVLIGGAACPQSMIEKFEKNYGVEVQHAWGMTEMSPLGTVGTLTAKVADMPYDKQMSYKLKQGHSLFTVEMKVVDDDGKELPRDGKSAGRLMVRGPAIAKGYLGGEGQSIGPNEWFDTGDISTLCPEGYMQITDRSKDVIKSGGEWISSIELENAAVGHPDVAEAAVIGLPHPKWDERPLLILAMKPGRKITPDQMREYLTGKIAKWWMPDDVVFVSEIPHTATGKIQKTALREMFKSHRLPTAAQ